MARSRQPEQQSFKAALTRSSLTSPQADQEAGLRVDFGRVVLSITPTSARTARVTLRRLTMPLPYLVASRARRKPASLNQVASCCISFRWTQNPVPSGECGFDSHLRHLDYPAASTRHASRELRDVRLQ